MWPSMSPSLLPVGLDRVFFLLPSFVSVTVSPLSRQQEEGRNLHHAQQQKEKFGVMS